RQLVVDVDRARLDVDLPVRVDPSALGPVGVADAPVVDAGARVHEGGHDALGIAVEHRGDQHDAQDDQEAVQDPELVTLLGGQRRVLVDESAQGLDQVPGHPRYVPVRTG